LHSFGAVHRDIKPENIIICGGNAVLIDFDASRIFKEESETDTQILGTTGFAAPEQYGFSQSDPKADIYSLGILLNVMLTGKHPSKELAKGRMGRIVQRCTMTNPKKRFKSVLHLMEML
ncbi:MAG: protein kinase, partial [Oscillospiraceae bacterium]|nr:protein kinase [Oscillospiraceae bacterium]